MQGVVNDYRLTRDHVSTMLTELTRVVDNARDNASLTGDVLSRIEASTRALNAAQLNAEEFMEGVSDVLGKSLTEFQHRLAESMTEVNRELVNRTSKVTSLLGQTIAELAQALELVVPNQEA
jgi:ABC-type transporter Mla subunit MlaD